MPIYEYACNKCGHTFDVLQKISDKPLKVCPECKKSALRKLISAPSFRLKGSGWYETDFKSGNKRNLADGGTSSTSDSGDKAASGDAGKADGGGKAATPGKAEKKSEPAKTKPAAGGADA